MAHADKSTASAARETLLAHLVEERELLLREATRILGSRDRAEDVLQDAAIRCLESSALRCEIDCPRAMLRRIVRNLALDQARKRGREPVMTLPADVEFVCERPRPDQSVEDRQCLARIRAEMDRLPPLHRRILLAHRLGDERQNHIARRVQLSPARVHAIITSAHEVLRACADFIA